MRVSCQLNSGKKQKSRIFCIVIFVALIAFLLSLTIQNSLIAAEEPPASLVETITWIFAKGATEGANAVLSEFFPKTWQAVKLLLSPAADVLMAHFPGFREWWNTPPGQIPSHKAQQAAQQAANELRKNPELQQLVIKGFRDLKHGQKEIRREIALLDAKFDAFAAGQKKSQEEIKAMLREVQRQIQERDMLNSKGPIGAKWFAGIWAVNCEHKDNIEVYVVAGPNKLKILQWSPVLKSFSQRTRDLIVKNSTEVIFEEDDPLAFFRIGYVDENNRVRSLIKIVDANTLLEAGRCDTKTRGFVWSFDCSKGWKEEHTVLYRCPKGTQLQ